MHVNIVLQSWKQQTHSSENQWVVSKYDEIYVTNLIFCNPRN